MTLKQKIHSERFRVILKANKVKKVAVFGSYARGQSRPGSDIDFLVDFEKDADLFDQIGLKNDLEVFLKKKTDVVTRASLNKYIRSRILKEAVDL